MKFGEGEYVGLVEIFGQPELIKHLEMGGRCYDHLISIGNPRGTFGCRYPGQSMPRLLRKAFRKYLRLAFFDAEGVDQLSTAQPKRIATRRDVRKAIAFYQETKDEANGYTLHCWSGVSRSAAVALGLLFVMTGSEQEAKAALHKARPQALPLKLIVKLFDAELGSNLAAVNELVWAERVAQWKEELDLQEDMLLEELPSPDEAR